MTSLSPRERQGAASSGAVPPAGLAALVPELLVSDIAASLTFWVELLGFRTACDRPAAGFAYLTRGPAQLMLCARNGSWETAAMTKPYGRGINLQISVAALAPILDALEAAGWGLYETPREAWYRAGNDEVGQCEVLVQDPDGYLVRLAEPLGLRAGADEPR